MNKQTVVIIGGGPAGLAAAIAVWEEGVQDILIVEREHRLGGILNQCIHNGFGLHTFQEELSGPEYALRYVKKAKELKIPVLLDTMVLSIDQEKILTLINREEGVFRIQAESIILAMGCRERPRGALNIPGYRPAGIYSAGTAQHFVNMEGLMPGKSVVILGSGDIGMIMARRMTLEGAKVKAVAELMPYSSGLMRNKVQCLDDYGIPLLLSTTVVDIKGKERVEGVTLAKVDQNLKPMEDMETFYSCDTLLLSCGLIPENELTVGMGIELNPVTSGPVVNEHMETSLFGVFACGNVLHVHDLVDYVSMEAKSAGKSVAEYVKGKLPEFQNDIEITGKDGVRYTVPAVIDRNRLTEDTLIRFRVDSVYRNAGIIAECGTKELSKRRKTVMAPGEMEQVILKKEDLLDCREKQIIIRIMQPE